MIASRAQLSGAQGYPRVRRRLTLG